MLRVELIGYEDLTEDEREDRPNNGSGKEYANYIRLSDAGETLIIMSDAVEPEDATFSRDFHEVIDAIEMAYKLGIRHGKLIEHKTQGAIK